MQSDLDDVDVRNMSVLDISFLEMMGINMMMCPANCLGEKTLSEDRGSGVEVVAAMVIRDI